jgi:hypothetical protein
MKGNIKRLRRIEEAVREEEGLTEEDFELILSVLPTEYADAVRKKLFETDDQESDGVDYHQPAKLRGKQRSRSGLDGKTLELIMNGLPPECAAALRAKLGIKEFFFNKELTK